MKKSKSPGKRKSAEVARKKPAAKPLRDLKVSKPTAVRGGMVMLEDYEASMMDMK